MWGNSAMGVKLVMLLQMMYTKMQQDFIVLIYWVFFNIGH
jgi:hypothetical protein